LHHALVAKSHNSLRLYINMVWKVKIMAYCDVLLCSLVDSADVSEEPAVHIFCSEEKLISNISLYLYKLLYLIFWFLLFQSWSK
jgi:hypothetical protein